MVTMSDAIIPDNAKVWTNYSAALFQDTPTPMILVNHPEVLDSEGHIIQEAWSEWTIGTIDTNAIARTSGWRATYTGMFVNAYGLPMNVCPVSRNITWLNNTTS